jgi:hypothetical protein
MKPKPILVVALMAVALAGCSPATDTSGQAHPIPGALCTVSIRRDALGVAGEAVVGPRTDVFNGGEASVHGRLQRVTPEWLVLDGRAEQELWIPKHLVLMIRVSVE